VSGEPATQLISGVRLGKELARWLAASVRFFAPSSIDRAAAGLAVIGQFVASLCAASVSFAAECPVLRIVVSGFGQLRVARIGNRWDVTSPCALVSHHKSTSTGHLVRVAPQP